jgi:integrase/recombinase XerD
VHGARPGSAGRAAPAPGALHPLDAGDPPVQALHRLPALLGHGRVLPDLRRRRLLEHSPAEHVRRPAVPAESPTLGFTHLQFEALLTAARESSHPCDFALVAMLGLLGLRIFEATGADICDLGEEHGHRVLRVCGKGTKVVLVPLPPAVGRAIDRATGTRTGGPVLLNSRGDRMDRHAATRRLQRLAEDAGVPVTRPHPHMLRHTFVTTMLDVGVDLRDVQIAARHADPRTTMRYDNSRELHQMGEPNTSFRGLAA